MNRSQVIDAIVTAGAVELSVEPRFPCRGGQLSTVYCDLRRILSHPRERRVVADALGEELANLTTRYDTIAATASGAIGWAALAADHPNVQQPFVYVTAEPKKHGSQSRIHGDLPPNHRVVLIEDVINRGGSAAQAVRILRADGAASVHEVLAVVHYHEKTELNDLKPSVSVRSLVSIHDLIELAADRQELTRAQIAAVLKHLDGVA